MYVTRNKKVVGSKVYTSTLLVEGYREGKKVKHRTISNLSSWPKELVEEFELLLRGGKVTKLEDLRYGQGKSCGALIAIYEVCKRLGILRAMGKSKKAQLAILMIMGRILTQGSRFHLVRSWSKDEAIEEVLKIKYFDEDNLYGALSWLSENQTQIENKLFKYRNKGGVSDIFLYDVTSSYLEGMKNELAEFGYNRDGKRGKKQIVIGLMTDKNGYPVSIEVFKGNTQDPQTVLSQLRKLKSRFGIRRVVFVGDRGMIKRAQIEDINEFKWNFITAITKSQMRKLVKIGVIQMGLFEEELAEVEHEGFRYIIRRNPERAKEVAANRESRQKYIINYVDKKNLYLQEHKKASVEIALRDTNKEVEKRKLTGIIEVKIESRQLVFSINKESLGEAERFDGCYVIKTDVSGLDKETIHKRYKDLSQVERAFRTIKTTFEEIRPIFVRKELETRGHVFICMLAYMVIKYTWDKLNHLGFTQGFIFQSLDRIQYVSYKFQNRIIKVLPNELLEHQRLILDELQINLPQRL